MSGIKLGFSFADFAKANNMGIGSIHLKDGSSVKILTNTKNNQTHFFHVNNGKLLGAYGSSNNGDIAAKLNALDKIKAAGENIDKAFINSFNIKA